MAKQSKPEPTTLFYRLHKLTRGLTYDIESDQFKGTINIDGRELPAAISKALLFDRGVLASCEGDDFEQFYMMFRTALAKKAVNNEVNRLEIAENEKFAFSDPDLEDSFDNAFD